MSINETEDQKRYRREKAMGRAIEEMLVHVSAYCTMYHLLYDSHVGDDAILGDQGIKPILQGIDTLLNGETGLLDCGKVSRHIHEIAAKHKMLDKNGEL